MKLITIAFALFATTAPAFAGPEHFDAEKALLCVTASSMPQESSVFLNAAKQVNTRHVDPGSMP